MTYPMSDTLYEHHKGNYYRIICVAKNSNTEEEMVVYRCCATGTAYTLPLTEFNYKVLPDETPRFELIG